MDGLHHNHKLLRTFIAHQALRMEFWSPAPRGRGNREAVFAPGDDVRYVVFEGEVGV